MSQLIGARIKALREERGLSQEELSRQLGFKDRQTLSAIENGDRKVTAEELLLLVQITGVTLDYFTDPFILVGEGRFSWRQSSVKPEILAACERDAGRWIAAYRTLAKDLGREIPLLRSTLGLTRQSSYEDAAHAGERFAAQFDLGEVPSRRLASVLEQRFGVLVLHVDAFEGISGAACRLPDLDVVLINRTEVPGRRHFDLAHEIFHILTWDAMPPEHSEEPVETSRSRVEQLANCFASALLMPQSCLDRFGDWKGLGEQALVSMLNRTADELMVTSSALRWRLVSLGRLPGTEARLIADSALRHNGREGHDRDPPPPFSRPFIALFAEAMAHGHISARRAAEVLDIRTEDWDEIFRQHGVDAPGGW